MPTAEQQQSLDLPLDAPRTGPLMKVFHHMQIHPELSESTEQQQQQQQQQQEREFKLLILSTLSQIVDEAIKKMTGDYESN
jgi:hypothetical protein